MHRQKRAGKFSDPLLDKLEAKRRRRRGIPDPPKGTTWSGSGMIGSIVAAQAAIEEVSDLQAGARFVGLTDVGRRRQNNEDCFFTGPCFAGVCDGLGGAPAGEVTSRLAAQKITGELTLARSLLDPLPPRELALQLRHAVEAANRDIHEKAKIDPSFRGMATTATVAAFVGHHLFVAQVGDSRAYLLRRGELVRLTRDQSCAGGLVEAGKITEEEARNFRSDFLTQAVGVERTVDVVLSYAELRRGDLVLLCSDGLHDMLPDEEIRAVCVRAPSRIKTCQLLIADALHAGGRDNVTVVVGRFDDPELSEPTESDMLFLRRYSPIGVQI